MQTGHRLQFCCDSCQQAIVFSVLESKDFSEIACDTCAKKYRFDPSVTEQLQQFEALCHQIHASSSILGKAAIAIDMDGKRVTLPFNLLLTRLSSVLDLIINGKKCTIAFRVEPLRDFPEVSCSRSQSPS